MNCLNDENRLSNSHDWGVFPVVVDPGQVCVYAPSEQELQSRAAVREVLISGSALIAVVHTMLTVLLS